MSDKNQKFLLAVAQPPTADNNSIANAKAHARAIRCAKARVIVFPELSISGYCFQASPLSMSDPAFEIVAQACADAGSVALVGAPTYGSDSDQKVHISIVLVSADETRVVYNKMNLAASETDHFDAGHSPSIVDIDGWRLGLGICRDTGQNAHLEQTASAGIDAYVAGVLESASDAATITRRAVSIANTHRVWVALASQAGPTGQGYDKTAGSSGIWRPNGTRVAQAGTRPGDIAIALLGQP